MRQEENNESLPFSEGQMLILEGPKLLENGPKPSPRGEGGWVVKF